MIRKYLGPLAVAGIMSLSLFTGPAVAADFGGDCCADLEERIAELEATTARKGNRKVSLKISGFVSQQVLWFDDGSESNLYVTDTGSVSIGTNVLFSGEAQITSDWSAGFAIKIETINVDSLAVSQESDEGAGAFGQVGIESSYWFLKSKTYGAISVGQQSSAVDNQAIIVDGSGSIVQANYVLYDVNSFRIRDVNGDITSITYGDAAECTALLAGGVSADCDGVPNNNVKYVSPVFGGFGFSASYGEDDVWGVSGRYAGVLGDFRLSAAVAYVENRDGGTANPNFAASHLQAGAYVQHNPTGLFLYGAYGTELDHEGVAAVIPEGETFYIKPGIRTKVNQLGHSVLYFEYQREDDNHSLAVVNGGGTASEFERFGIGIVQEVDAAAMSLFLAYRHSEAEFTGLQINGVDVNDSDIDQIKAGALISF